ncbi:ExeM/NucH family extracellular endonuclease [Sediminicurvatus halobius]|uniref:ExeM/NucH family extracellular endonuclease n=1 Tax=Sediminicurvatus halobius TaxID=2182432 RepID=UPI001304E690|nr:ExeM/NucH family extracellular endonuclease [Spiribacter halobius]UEX79444.1 ExeM/NucH family extracellular endonuclease [Spiribacter halobius]
MTRRFGGCGLVLALLPAVAAADCGEPATPLAAVRGAGEAPLPPGRMVTVEATVTGSFPGGDGLDGFYVESATEPRAGVFVYAPEVDADAAPRSAERWRIRARTGRYRGRIQLESAEALQRCGTASLEPAPLRLPAAAGELAGHSDRLVRLEGALVVTDAWDLARYGSLALASPQRRMHPANGTAGGEPAGVILDDGSYRRGPEPIPHLDAEGTRRLGSRVESAVGVLTRAFGAWRLHPVQPVRFRDDNPRRLAPVREPGALRAVNFNLRNYFLDRAGRGPDTPSGFERQRRRLAASLEALDADVLALHEIENRPAVVRDLLRLVNAGRDEARRYAAAAAAMDRRGVIRSALLYRPARLTLESVRLDAARVHDRPPVIADFRDPDGQRLRVAAAHFKSRGGCPQAGDVDRGEGCWAQRRRAQADALADALAADGPAPVLLLGDLNAYPAERALAPLRAAGLVDLVAREVPAPRRYTYVYRGAAGYLDHALASHGLAGRVARVGIWHVNADEPPFLADRGDGVWRASDHDPVVVDLR